MINLLLFNITEHIAKKDLHMKKKVWRQREKENCFVNMNDSATLNSMDNSYVEW